VAARQILVHVDDELHAAIVEWARDQERSMSAQVRMVLRDALPARYLHPRKLIDVLAPDDT
jgi:hypothetical protein